MFNCLIKEVRIKVVSFQIDTNHNLIIDDFQMPNQTSFFCIISDSNFNKTHNLFDTTEFKLKN